MTINIENKDNYNQMADYISDRLYQLQKQHNRNSRDTMAYLNPVDINELELLTRIENQNSNKPWGLFEFHYKSIDRDIEENCIKLDRICETVGFDIEVFEHHYGEYTGPYDKLERLKNLFQELFPNTDCKLIQLGISNKPNFTYRND